MLAPKRLLEKLSLSLLVALIAAIGVLVFFGWLTDEVLEGDTLAFDEATRAAVHQLASPTLTTIMRGISFFGGTRFLFGATTIIVLSFIFRKWKREAILLTVTMIGASLLNITLKLTFKRVRPEPFFNLATPKSWSFPSGHSLASFCFFGALAVIVNARIKSRRLRIAIGITAAVIIFLIGLSRIYLGVHYATDVIAGFTAALIWIGAVKFVEDQLVRRRRRRMRDEG
ncbi:MAG TPA: phosphatase PAP2 family protein [Pyrinomonadaceae bacterium]|nr:phosphatase PAP2 family protein [Pyrinomonadaceae bacterium]